MTIAFLLIAFINISFYQMAFANTTTTLTDIEGDAESEVSDIISSEIKITAPNHINIQLNIKNIPNNQTEPEDNGEPTNPGEINGFRILSANVTSPDASSQVLISGSTDLIQGTAGKVSITNTRTGNQQIVNIDGLGTYQSHMNASVGDTLQLYPITTSGDVGQIMSVVVQGTGLESPALPDPKDIAPPLNPTESTNVYDMTEFLYKNNPKIQFNVDSDTIKPEQASLLVGKVFNRDNQPLSGVEISVKDFPEYGHTFSREDGNWDLVINGGQNFTVNYQKEGYLPVQRQVQVKWQDYGYLPDVVMIPLDSKVSFIDLTDNSQNFQVHESSVSVDDDGERRTTVLFPKGLTAKMVFSDGREEALNRLNIRATEYTIGENGPEAMPGELPPTSAYTFAAEFSADEAIIAGAETIAFSEPVIVYVDNFLNFPEGTVVPVGYYDFNKAAWVGSENGRVIKVLSITGNQAVLAVSDTGTAATAAELSDLSITETELNEIAKRFQAGDSFWRVQKQHFTPWDWNWPYFPGCEGMCTPPPQCEEGVDECYYWWDKPNVPDNEDNCKAEGCIIDIENGEVGENIELSGLEFGISYHSSRQKNEIKENRRNATITRRISGDQPYSTDVKRIESTYQFLGRVEKFVYDEPRLLGTNHKESRFTWDGLDRYARSMSSSGCINVGGATLAIVGAVYTAPEDRGNAWATWGATSLSISSAARKEIALSRPNSGFAVSCPPHLSKDLSMSLSNNGNDPSADIEETETTQINQGMPGVSPLLQTGKLGGWTIDIHHFYNPNNWTLYKGDNTTISATSFKRGSAKKIASLPAGSQMFGLDASGDILHIQQWIGRLYLNKNGNDQLILEDKAIINNSTKAFLSPNKKIYLQYYDSDSKSYQLARVTNDGNIIRISGTANSFGVDKKISDTKLFYNATILVDKNERFYVASPNSSKIYTFSAEGLIQEFSLSSSYTMKTITLNGGVLLQSQQNGLIYELTSAGELLPYLGKENGHTGLDAENKLSSEVKVNAEIMKFDWQNNLFFTERATNGKKLIRTNKNNIIETLTGDLFSEMSERTNDRDYPPVAMLNSDNFYMHPSTGFVVQDGNSVYQIQSPMPSFTGKELMVPQDNSEIYVFSSKGKHLRTIDGLTGAILYKFDYHSDGTLAKITNHDGLVTRINGNQIISPFGQVTTLHYNPSGMLKSVTNPQGESYRIEYNDALMTKFTKPDGKSNALTYDSDTGRLKTDTWANGGGWEIDYTKSSEGYHAIVETTRLTSAEGVATEYQTRNTNSSVYASSDAKTITFADGTQINHSNLQSNYRTSTYSDGTQARSRYSTDSRFGSNYLINSEITGGAASLNQNILREYTQDEVIGDEFIPVRSYKETITLGSYYNPYKIISEYDYDANTWTYTSPMNKQVVYEVDKVHRPLNVSIDGIAPVHYQYNGNGQITDISQTDGTNTRFSTYDYYTSGANNGYLKSQTNALRQTVHYEYDLAGRLTKQTLPDRREIVFEYYEDGALKSITPPDRNRHLFEYTSMDDTNAYRPPALSGPSTDTTYEYNLDRNLTAIRLPSAESIHLNYDATTGKLASVNFPDKTLNYAYNAGTGALVNIADSNGNAVSFEEQAYSLTKLNQSGDVNASFKFGYDSRHNISHIILNNIIINYTYNDDNEITRIDDIALNYDANNGLLLSTDYQGIAANYAYNTFADTTLVTYGDVVNTDSISIDNYVTNDQNLLLDMTVSGQVSKVIVKKDGLEVMTKNIIAGQVDYSDSILLDPEQNNIEVLYYDTVGNQIGAREIKVFYQDNANKTIRSALRYTNDAFFYIDLLGNISRLDLATNTVSILDKPNAETYDPMTVDMFGRIYYHKWSNDLDAYELKVYEGDTLLHTYKLNSENRPLVTDKGNVYTFTDPTSLTSRAKIYQLYSDGSNSVLYTAEERDIIFGITDDKAGGLIFRTETLDAPGRDPSDIGWQCKEIPDFCKDPVIRHIDSSNQVTTLFSPADDYTNPFWSFIIGNQSVICMGDSWNAACYYADEGYATPHEVANEVKLATPLHQKIAVTQMLWNKYTAAYLVSNPGRSTESSDFILASVDVPSISSTISVMLNNSSLLSYAYQRDEVGRIKAITESSADGDKVYAYTYNDVGKLIEANENGQVTTWAYDANGNRSHENGVEVASYDAQDRLTRYKDNAYTYNLLGQLTNKTSPRGTANYNYDVQGNLLGVETELGNRIEYLIDPLNRRVGRKVDGTITNKYLYLGQLHPIAELYPDTDQLKYLFIYAEKAQVPSAIEHYNESNQLIATYRVLTNHLGSVVKVVNTDDQSIVQAIEYDAWGNVLSDTNPLFQPFYYAGGLYDPETKLTRFGARDYDAEIGRWTAKDPIGFAGGLTSLYDYVGGDPTNFIDPSGEAPWGVMFAIANFGWQLYKHGGDIGCVDWRDVGLSMLGGGVLNGFMKKAFVLKKYNESHTWSATRSWMNRKNIMMNKPNMQRHHWLFERNQGIGKHVPDFIKNQPWNINLIPAKYNNWLGRKPWRAPLGAPPWAKEILGGSLFATFGGKGDGCECKN